MASCHVVKTILRPFWSGEHVMHRTAVFISGIVASALIIVACAFDPSGEAADDDAEMDAMPMDDDAGTDGGMTIIDAAAEPPNIVEFTVSDDKVRVGETVSLTWTTNASVVVCAATANNGATDFSGSQAANGLVDVVPLFRTTTYTLICFDQSGAVSEPKSVAVRAMRMSVTNATVVSDGNYSIPRGQQVPLVWDGDNTVSTSCGGMSQPSVQGGLSSGAYEVAGSRPQFAPLSSAMHTFTCFDGMGNTTHQASIYIEVIPPPP
ncbi:MAG: hypothetical protein A2534_02380 [Candidatus Magasanikbacteria bacterium RIFOXYD2_FULL_39_9]|nr:MAG: hypothetical protein A2534_02380 [Candidatus Magasanikbacteria bacterium RIFOXYD2_FULL_39_9]